MANTRITSEDYTHPYRPLAIRMLNRFGSTFGVSDSLPSAEALMAVAQKRTGLSDFGDEALLEPLRKLLWAMNEEGKLTTMGVLGTKGRIISILVERLRVEEAVKKHPEILETEITDPVFIVGLQRSGTTILQRLLAADPKLRSLKSYEAVSPAGIPKRFWHREDLRITKARFTQRTFKYLAPDFFAVHPIDALSPEEELLLLDYTFFSTVSEAMISVPSYARWLESQDQTSAYRYLKKLLQLLMWQAPADRWVLKTPHHLEWLDTLVKVFPDAKIIQTHRDPQKMLASFCSMISHLRGAFSDEVHPFDIGKEWSSKVKRMLNRGMASRDRLGEDRFFDVSYYDLMNDPFTEIERIYGFMERPFSKEARDGVNKALGKNEKHKHGIHRYHPEDFDLNSVVLERIFAKYRSRFDIPHED